MKKLLLVLLVVALASFLFVSCTPTVPAEGEGEGEGEGEVEGVTVAIADSVKVGDYTYVSAGSHDITVTFPAPVAGLVSASISPCSGDYSKAFIADGSSVVLFPDATKKIWTGSGSFQHERIASGEGFVDGSLCCASYVEVVSGECAEVVCIAIPIIVDGAPPYATIAVSSDYCICDGCEVTFESSVSELLCADVSNCGDDCSGLASWSFDLYATDPFDICCLVPCIEPVYTCSGVDCPILCTTSCIGLTDLQVAAAEAAYVAGSRVPAVIDPHVTYYVVETLADEVGNTQRYYATITLDSACAVTVVEYPGDNPEGCATFETPLEVNTHIILAD